MSYIIHMSIWQKLHSIIPSRNLTEAEELWLEGWKMWRAWLASSDIEEANMYAKKAEDLFQRTLDLDPGTSDAALGIHAVSARRRDEMLCVMTQNRERLGQYSEKFSAPIFSTWKPMLFAAWRLSDGTDVLRSEVANLIREDSTHQAWAALSSLPQDHLAEALRIALLYREERWDECLEAAKAAALHPLFANDLRTIVGVCLRERGSAEDAGDLLRRALRKASSLSESQYISREYSLCLDYSSEEELSSKTSNGIDEKWDLLVESFFGEAALDPRIIDNRN